MSSSTIKAQGIKAKGACLCGSVKVTASKMSKEFGACHCGMCKNWGGGPLLATDCGAEVSFEGEENITVYNSSDWAERGFCKNCGTHLFYRLKQGQLYHMPIGLFSDLPDMKFSSQIFIDSKPDWYEFKNDTQNMTGEEVFAMYAPPQD